MDASFGRCQRQKTFHGPSRRSSTLWTDRPEGDYGAGVAKDDNFIFTSSILYIVYNITRPLLVPHSRDRLLLLHMFSHISGFQRGLWS